MKFKTCCYLYQIWYHTDMATNFKLQVVFYKSKSEKEPVRDWLKKLDREDRKTIGEDIKTPLNDLKVAKQRMLTLGGQNE